MHISTLIAKLQEVREDNGDIPVFCNSHAVDDEHLRLGTPGPQKSTALVIR